jgi:hypothetical protein
MIVVSLLFLFVIAPGNIASCTEDDKGIWRGNENFTKEYLRIAGLSFGVKALARKGFEKTFPMMAEGCRECHVNMIACGVEHCAKKCGRPKSEDCNECIEVKCMGQYKPCLGVWTEGDLPIPPYKLA